MPIIKRYLYKCKCGHTFYKDVKRRFYQKRYTCRECGKRTTKFKKTIKKFQRERRHGPR